MIVSAGRENWQTSLHPVEKQLLIFLLYAFFQECLLLFHHTFPRILETQAWKMYSSTTTAIVQMFKLC